MDEALFRTDLGKRLRRARVAAGLTQQTLANRSGVSRPSIANIESGRQGTDVSVLLRLADTCGVSVGYLADHEPGPTVDTLEAIERIRAYCAWSRRTHCAGSGDSIEALLTDDRPAVWLTEASERTGHILGCDCSRCGDDA